MRLYEYCSSINSLQTLSHPLNTKIYVGPDGRVLVLRKDWGQTEQYSTIFDHNGTYFYSWGSYFFLSDDFLRMDAQIIQHARKILERKHAEQYEENKKNCTENRISKLESGLERVFEMIKQCDENTMNQLGILMCKLDSIINTKE